MTTAPDHREPRLEQFPPLGGCLVLGGADCLRQVRRWACYWPGPLMPRFFLLDSMAVYRGMDIGTAKPSPEQAGRSRTI